jgi:copper(I)-binding protein
MLLPKLHLLAACLVLAASAHAHDYKVGALTIAHPYARFTVPGQTAGGGFLSVENRGGADRLVGARAPVCDRVELHTMRMEGDVMRMRQVDGIDLPPGRTVELAPGGHHLMLMGLKAPLKVGDKFPLTLQFRQAGEVTVEVQVEAPPPGREDHRH